MTRRAVTDIRGPSAEVPSKKYRHVEDVKPPEVSAWSRWLRKRPIRSVILSFAFVIALGTLLLSLPVASAHRGWTPFSESLFTATSATCVTGLIVHDTATYWSLFGKIVILALIQIGGLGLMTIMGFFLLAARRPMEFDTLRSLQETTGADSLPTTSGVLAKIILLTAGFEVLGTVLLTWRFSQAMGMPRALGYGVFHSISAFCNAGFDLMGSVTGPFTSMTAWNHDHVVLLTLAGLLIFGGLGFVVWIDLLKPDREQGLKFHTRVVLIISGILLVAGTVAYLLTEWGQTMPGGLGALPAPQRGVAAFFQSATLRTAGFNSIDQATMSPAGKLMGVVLMFIGASPVSTGGGLKTTTFAIIVAAVVGEVRRRKDTVLFRHRLERHLVYRALILMMLGLTLTLGTSVWLLITERAALAAGNYSALDLVYEAFSAMGTVGVSAAGTPTLRAVSRVPLIALMFLGRIGPLSFALGLFMDPPPTAEKVYPVGRPHVG